MTPRTSFGERLIAAGMLTQAQLDLALREQKRKGGLLGQILVQLGFVKAEVLSAVLAKEAEAETVNLQRLAIDQSVLQLVPLPLARRFRAVPVSRDGERSNPIAVVVESDGRRLALEVDDLLGQHQVVVKNLEANYRRVPGVSGATILGDGRVALIVDPAGIAQTSRLPAAA